MSDSAIANVSIANVTRAEASGDRSIRRMLIGRELYAESM